MIIVLPLVLLILSLVLLYMIPGNQPVLGIILGLFSGYFGIQAGQEMDNIIRRWIWEHRRDK